MDIICGKCGIEEALYECTSCNKNFCIEDWDKIHQDNQHQKQKITFSVNEKSRELLIIFFEKLKKEMIINYNLYKELTLGGIENINWDFMKCVNANSLLNAVIFYLMKIKFITKKIIYNPIEYFLVNSQVLAEKYTQLFDLLHFYKFPANEIHLFLIKNYLIYEPMNYFYNKSNDVENLLYFVNKKLMDYLIYHQYKQALEFLENLKELLMFHKWLDFKMDDIICIIRSSIFQISHQSYNINMILWEEVENKLKQSENYYESNESYLFYYAFLSIFCILENKIYFAHCLKCILKMLRFCKSSRNVIDAFYLDIFNFYETSLNKDKMEKYLLKRLHLYAKNGQLICYDEEEIHSFLDVFIRLISFYADAKKNKKKEKWIDKFWDFFKNLKPKSVKGLTFLLFNYGRVCFFSQDYDSALNYLKNAEHKLKKSKLIGKRLSILITYYLGLVYFKIGDYKLSVKNIYKAKESTEERLGNSFIQNLNLNRLLGEIYMKWEWLDEALKYFELAKDSYLKWTGNENSIRIQSNLIDIEYSIANIYYCKGEVNRPLKIYENVLFLIEQRKYYVVHRKQKIVELNCYIGLLYYQLGIRDKANYYLDVGFRSALDYIDLSSRWDYVRNVLNAAFGADNHKIMEKCCLKVLEILPDSKINQEKLEVYGYLMIAYAHQENYEKSDQIFDIIKSNWTILNKNLRLQLLLLVNCGEIFHERKNYNEADIYYQKAKDLIESSMKASVIDKGGLFQKIGWNYIFLGRYEDSEHYLFKALDIFLENDSNYNLMRALLSIAELYRYKNDTQKRKHYLLEYIKFSKQRNVYLREHGIILILLICISNKENDYVNLIELFSELREYTKKTPELIEVRKDFMEMIEMANKS